MVSRPLGATGLWAGPIGLGTVKLGRRSRVKYPVDFDLPTDAEIESLLDSALDLGVNLFDTAPAYGTSEKRLARFVSTHRGEIVLATKCGEVFEGGSSRWDFRRSALERQIAESLKRLGTDYVDLLLLHANDSDEDVLTKTDAVATLVDAKGRGQARAVGISAKTEAGIRGAVGVLDAVMAPFNCSDQSLGPALESAHDAGLAVLGIKSLQQGRATNPHDSIAWVTTHNFIDVVVVGTLSPRHLATAVKAVSA